MRRHLLASAAMAVAMATGGPAFADMAAAERWVDEEFQPSVLTREEQLDEMEWFVQAAEPYRGMEINIVAEAIPTHDYEAEILTRAFEEITGIRVNMQIIGEGDVVQALQTQMQTGRNIYDMYVNDADLIGMHSRLGQTVNLDEWMAGEGADVTLPTLDVEDFFGRLFATGPDGSLWQLPDQQFANLYWFRKDWFDREDFQEQFQELYGYELGVPVDWSAYEDIAEFFTEHVREIDGVRVYGHMDYGKRAPDLGWRMTDAWLSMAGAGDKGLPNGRPVDEWGIRMEEGSCNPAGASITRGGATNGPAAVYAVRK
jgi:glycerol transport system substrate-binding protein